MRTRFGEGRGWLAVALLLGAALRLPGLAWALPGELHRFSFHPDEWQTVETALRMLADGDLNPRFFNYPSLHLYLTAAWLRLAAPGGLTVPLAYLTARLLSALLGLATLLVVWRIGCRLGSPRLGAVTAALLATLPLHAVNSQFATVDIALTFWVSLSLWAAVEIAVGEGPVSRRPALLGAVAAGLAAGTKYNGLLVLAPLLVALVQRERRPGLPLAAVALAGAVCLATSPYLLIDPLAWPQIRYELFEHPRQSNLYVGVGPGWWFHLTRNLPVVAGWPVLPLLAAGLPLAWRRPAARPLVIWLLVVALSMLRTAELFSRYWLPALPALAVLMALAGRELARRPGGRAALGAILVAQLAVAAAAIAPLTRSDPRELAAEWCFRNVPAEARVGVDGEPWFWSVPLQPNNGGARTRSSETAGRYQLVTTRADWPTAEWLVVNLTRIAEGDALGETPPWAEASAGWTPVATFAPAGPRWWRAGPHPRLHDWNYIWPDIAVLRRSETAKTR